MSLPVPLKTKRCIAGGPMNTNLFGRPELKAGANGRQLHFLDLEDFKTIQERERINAADDIDGQKSLLIERNETK